MSRYPRNWAWPNAAKIAISVNLAFEWFHRQSQYTQISVPGAKDPFSLSYAEYAVKSGGPRILDLMDELELKGSMSTSGFAAEVFPRVVKDFVDAGHEIVGHGWANDEPRKNDDPDAELAEIRRCTAALTAASGGVQPVGWTSPGSAGSEKTLGFLKGEGYLWNGDDASDDLPFVRDTANGPMVVMPRTNIPHNDLVMWLAAKNPPSVMFDGWKDTFDQLYAEGTAGSPKWTEITLHLHMAGRPTLVPVIRKCLAYAKSHGNVWFALKRDIAKWALERETAN